MEGEEQLSEKILELIPSCRVKNNIIIRTSEGNAEIDCLVLVGSRLFAIEVKRWKGDIIETDQCMIQKKVDQWTDEIHTKQHKSPFKQLGRAIYFLRNQVKSSAWVNPIVFFEDADSVHIESDGVWLLMNRICLHICHLEERVHLEVVHLICLIDVLLRIICFQRIGRIFC
jgi:hypothetical protein